MAGEGAPQEKRPIALGPFHTVDGLARWLRVSPESLLLRVEAGSLLACPGDDGLVFPSWQFRLDGTEVPHLSELVRVLGGSSGTPWATALWLRTPLGDAFEGMNPVSWLAGGNDPAPVLAEAHTYTGRRRH